MLKRAGSWICCMAKSVNIPKKIQDGILGGFRHAKPRRRKEFREDVTLYDEGQDWVVARGGKT